MSPTQLLPHGPHLENLYIVSCLHPDPTTILQEDDGQLAEPELKTRETLQIEKQFFFVIVLQNSHGLATWLQASPGYVILKLGTQFSDDKKQ